MRASVPAEPFKRHFLLPCTDNELSKQALTPGPADMALNARERLRN